MFFIESQIRFANVQFYSLLNVKNVVFTSAVKISKHTYVVT